jgi:Protein of unknown function (DUF2752)
MRKFKYLGFFVLLLLLIFLYRKFNPSENIYFPQCPTYKYLHFKCPGCGSQRAVHQLLHGNIWKAMEYNLMLVIAIPYLMIGFIFNQNALQVRYPKIRKFLFGRNAIIIILGLIAGYMVYRNV